LDFVALDLDFVASGLVFVAKNLDIVAENLDSLALEIRPRMTDEARRAATSSTAL
jgi:hypothetical protein